MSGYVKIHNNTQEYIRETAERKCSNAERYVSKERYTLQLDSVPTRNNLDYSATPQNKRNLEYSGLGESRLHCSYETTPNRI
jgi:hypothetical protein